MEPVSTWIVSLALCLLCSEVGVKDTVMSFPAEPAGGKNPEEGVTVKSPLLPRRSAAVNCTDLLHTKYQILRFKEYCAFYFFFFQIVSEMQFTSRKTEPLDGDTKLTVICIVQAFSKMPFLHKQK